MAEALTFRLIGHGIAYSASPAIMSAAFATLGLPHRYVLADVAPGDVAEAVAAVRAADGGGANVTVPYKADVLPHLDEVSDLAVAAQSVNTIVKEGSRLVGHNTDMPATIEVIERLCPHGVTHAVVLGAGGAGRAVELALHRLGVERVELLHRSDGSIERLPAAAGTAELLVNASPVGTGTDESPLPRELHRPGLSVLDLVYRPDPTRLVREARAAGATAETGAAVLLGQAWRALELWLGRPAPIDVMRTALARELETHDA
jgi:shikimate dehydrogenase